MSKKKPTPGGRAKKKLNDWVASCVLNQMVAAQYFIQWFLAIRSIKTLRKTANASWLNRVTRTELLMLTMFFKGRSKAI